MSESDSSTPNGGGAAFEKRNETRRSGYYVANANGTFAFRVFAKVADATVLAELHTVVQVVFHIQPIAIALESVLRNRADLFEFVDASAQS